MLQSYQQTAVAFCIKSHLPPRRGLGEKGSWLLQGPLDHRHWFEHSAALMLINSFQIHAECVESKALLTALCCFLTLQEPQCLHCNRGGRGGEG